MRPISLLQQLLGAKVRGAKYREVNDPATEIWRACQISGTAGLLVMSVLPRVYIVDRARKILTNVVLTVPRDGTGVKCHQVNKLRPRLR